MANTRHRCPNCKSSEHLWEGVLVEGWRAIDAELNPSSDHGVNDFDWRYADPTGNVGCMCGWEGVKSSLEALGVDGEPLPAIHPDQQTLEAA